MFWVWITTSLAGPPEVNLLHRADTTWRSRAGQADIARSTAATSSAQVWGGGPSRFTVDAQLGVASQQQLLLQLEQPLSFGFKDQAYRHARADTQQALTEAARWSWIRAVHQDWIQWWVASQIEEHLHAHLRKIDQEREHFQKAMQDGLLAPADYADLVTESLLVQQEFAEIHRLTRISRSKLQTVLGDTPYPEGPDLDTPLPTQNPWESFHLSVETFPTVNAAKQLAVQESKHARALAQQRLPSVYGGIMWAPDVDNTMRPFANLGLSIPLQTGVSSDRRQALGEAHAASAQAQWRKQQLTGDIRVESENWQALHEQLTHLQQVVLQPLRDRERRLASAQASGHTSIDRLVRGRRDLHEAEHRVLLLTGALLQSNSRAELLRLLIEAQ